MTADQLHILQHALGCNGHGQSAHRSHGDEGDGCMGYHRNRYVSDPTPDLCALTAAGLLEDRGAVRAYGGMHYYLVTAGGVLAMKDASPPGPKLTASQRRYREWLKADRGVTFGEWITAR